MISDGSYSNGKMAEFKRNGAVELYYDNNLKLETYADGVSISSKILVGTGTNGTDAADEITVANTGNAGITIRSGTANDGSLFFSDGDGTSSVSDEYRGYVQYNHSLNNLYFGSNGILSMTLDSNQNVGIGTHTPSSWNGDANKLVIYEANANTGMTISTNCNYNSNIFFADADTDGAPEYAGYIQYSHSADELRLGASATDKVKITNSNVTLVNADLVVSNGNGINFGATADGGTGTSNRDELLKDYEQGDWTPILNGSTSSPSGGTFQYNRAKYTRVGNLVHLMAYVQWHNNWSGAAGAARISGLPFAGNTYEYGSVSIGFHNVAASTLSNGYTPAAYVDGTYVYFYQLGHGTGSITGQTYNAAAWYNSYAGHVQFTATYRTSA